jgi:hypothetical protein
MKKEFATAINSIPDIETYPIHHVDNKFQIKNAGYDCRKTFPDFDVATNKSGIRAKNKTNPVPRITQGKLSKIPEAMDSQRILFFIGH